MVPVSLTLTEKILRSKFGGHESSIDYILGILKLNQNVWCSDNALPTLLKSMNAKSEYDLLTLRFEKLQKLKEFAHFG